MKYFYNVVAIIVLIAGSGICQVPVVDEPPGGLKPAQPPPLSPPAQTSVTIAGQKITIKYSSPSIRKSVIFGGLVPYRQVWRAGANDATLLHTTADLEFNGLLVPKGDYSLFVWPEPQQWLLIINKQTGQSGLEYHQQQDLGRVPMELSHPPKTIERYKMTLSKGAGAEGELQLAWENTVAKVGFTVRPPK
jgi:hypothetical protein